jgi:hypothetical protein
VVLSRTEIDAFVRDGFIRLAGGFSRELADACVDELWRLSGVDRHDRSTWTEPVVRVAGSAAEPIVAAINTDRVVGAIDDVVGVARWQRRTGYGSFPIRFPSDVDPGDTGWHIDGIFEVNDDEPPWNYGVNVRSRGRALLLLMLFSDVGTDDAPTRIRVGSHRDVAPWLMQFGERGTVFTNAVPQHALDVDRLVVDAIGEAGDVYLCHPFLVHAASWPHRGGQPRFIGQPAILHAAGSDGFDYERPDPSPCELAVRASLSTHVLGVHGLIPRSGHRQSRI